MTTLPDILEILRRNNVEFVVIGGVAAVLHGSAFFTQDLDICYNRTPGNLVNLIAALTPLHPKLRNAPEDLPFIFDERTLKNGLNFTFDTDLGKIDILGEVGGVGYYQDALKLSVEKEVFGVKCKVLDVSALIASKKFAGRSKDAPVIMELEVIQEMLEKQKRTE